ncbi:hypothetical protein TRL7639_00052 [Falsiruegeria litorea R37]|uniref:Uncharacterized protein n=2 Tax=Falsiruegeria litorea TaxID=1280831 RepID=A0A1Y5R9E7_9RHOB|nr:hypothetical protein TRL7639_00052 [Falsiruegeria litorea R37]
MTRPRQEATFKPLQFRVTEEEFDYFSKMAAEFAGFRHGAKTALFRELISHYECNPGSDGDPSGNSNVANRPLNEQLSKMEAILADVERQQAALLDRLGEHEERECRHSPDKFGTETSVANHSEQIGLGDLLSKLSAKIFR